MSIFGSQRDFGLIKKMNRALLRDIIEQEIGYYKISLNETQANIYGESSEKMYYSPVLMQCLITRGDQVYTVDDFGPDLTRTLSFAFLRDDLVDQNLVPEVGDIILYYGGYYEIDNTNANQFIVGKDPDFPYNVNPLNPGLEIFGSNFSIICETHYVPGDKPGIKRVRL